MTKQGVLTDVSTAIAAWTTFTSQTLAADFVPVENKICSAQVEREIIEAPVSPLFYPTRVVAVCFASLRVVPTMRHSAATAAWNVSNKFSFKTLLDLLMKHCL